MKPSGIVVTPEELAAVNTARECSGMWLSDGQPLGDPAYEVHKLCQKYKMPEGTGFHPGTGEFHVPDDWQPPIAGGAS